MASIVELSLENQLATVKHVTTPVIEITVLCWMVNRQTKVTQTAQAEYPKRGFASNTSALGIPARGSPV
ncbi:hypothetical protein HOLleu_19534 [Holothuria leucospilota]|uniref:Uncharacterized protein n=1 Tax=Holothuria leucospilota TaxID=206669 RepID=A0A9Q1H7V6_HOLLE|nr:hypothetical protein HOLleu_19534 [Holothuria leucospilota]